jgi:uncharacterized membrane protein YhaH (DUF805 family)
MNKITPKLTVWWALFSFRGRISRQSYFLGGALMLVMQIYIMLNMAQADRNSQQVMAVWGFVFLGFCIIAIFVVLALSVKRLHDLDLSPTWVILLFVPAVSLLFVAYLMFANGSQETNAHGPPPFPIKKSSKTNANTNK